MKELVNCGWAGTIQEFLCISLEDTLSKLIEMLQDDESKAAQIIAWQDCLRHLHHILKHYQYSEDFIIFEYIIPRSGLSRPDVIILQQREKLQVKVLEFKSFPHITDAEKWQLRLYLKKLKLYHELCYQETAQVDGILITTAFEKAEIDYWDEDHKLHVTGINSLLRHLHDTNTHASFTQTTCMLTQFLNAKYKPSPAITQSARILFQNRDIPKISTNDSTNFEEVLKNVENIIKQAQVSETHHLVLIHGEPGAGKTYLGLKIAHTNYSTADIDGNIVYLSGNEPLVEVLENLTDERFVQHLYKYKGDYKDNYLNPSDIPEEQIIIFDEAQRAWDKEKVDYKNLSEPDIILDIATQVQKAWSVTIALIGHGQEIKGGEEGGLTLWAQAVKKIEQTKNVKIKIHGSKNLDVFEGYGLQGGILKSQNLYLNSSLRHHDAQKYHEFVHAFLEADIELAYSKYQEIKHDYLLVYTDDFELAKRHLKRHASNIQDGRFQYGAIHSSTSSRDKNFKRFEYGATFDGMKSYVVYYNYEQIKHHSAFLKYPNSKSLYSNSLVYSVSEYQCQGLEVDIALLEWGDDLFWKDGSWDIKQKTYKHKDSKDPYKLILNTYRVLLTRGRDATIIFTKNPEMLDLFKRLGIKLLASVPADQ